MNLPDNLPNRRFLRGLVLRAVEIKSPGANRCGVKTWLRASRIAINPAVVDALLDESVLQGYATKTNLGAGQGSPGCASADLFTLSDTGRAESAEAIKERPAPVQDRPLTESLDNIELLTKARDIAHLLQHAIDLEFSVTMNPDQMKTLVAFILLNKISPKEPQDVG